MAQSPRISMIACTDGSFEVVRRSVELLLGQTKLNEIQVILVGPSIGDMKPDLDVLSKFGAYDVVEFGEFETTGAAMAAGLQVARGEFFVFIEEHGFPPNDFAEKLLCAFDETGSDVVGYGLLPSNPGAVSWAHIYLQFGGAVPPRPSGYQKRLGPHHVSYRVSALKEQKAHLGDLLSNEAAFHELLRSQGGKLYYHGDLALMHGQISDFKSLFVHEFLSGITFADARYRGQNWSVAKRVIYVLGSPLIPFWRTSRAMTDMSTSGRLLQNFPLVPLIMLAVTTSGAAGEAIGYIFGANKSVKDRRSKFELDRFAYVNQHDMETAPRTTQDVRSIN